RCLGGQTGRRLLLPRREPGGPGGEQERGAQEENPCAPAARDRARAGCPLRRSTAASARTRPPAALCIHVYSLSADARRGRCCHPFRKRSKYLLYVHVGQSPP